MKRLERISEEFPYGLTRAEMGNFSTLCTDCLKEWTNALKCGTGAADQSSLAAPSAIFLTSNTYDYDYDYCVYDYEKQIKMDCLEQRIDMEVLSFDRKGFMTLRNQIERSKILVVVVRMEKNDEDLLYALSVYGLELHLPIIFIAVGTEKCPPSWFIELMEKDSNNLFDFSQKETRPEVSKTCLNRIKELIKTPCNKKIANDNQSM